MNWKRGITLMTATTKRWNKEDIEKNDIIEQSMVFSNFCSTDYGRSRELVCTLNIYNPEYEKNAKLIETAPEIYSILKQIHDITEDNRDTTVIDKELYKKIVNVIKSLS